MLAATRKRAIKRLPAPPARRPARAHLLVIECDSQRLASQGLHLGTAFGQVVKALFPNKRIAVVRTSTEDKLREDLAKVFEECGRFRNILIVGHSNPDELMLTSEGCRPWATVGQWLRILEPEFLFLAACEAGQSAAVRGIFGSVDSLRQIYASPVTLYKIHTAPLGVLVYMLLANGKINPDQSEALRMVHYIVSGGQLCRWRRNETGPGRELTGKLWDAVGNALNFGPWDLFERLFPRPGRP
jgi:hypothetical protein